jgi:hypothetical protein
MAEVKHLANARELIQRVQVGLVGLVGVLLIVGLANFMIRNARSDDTTLSGNYEASAGGTPTTSANGSAATPASEPLADLGVTPSNDPSLSATPAVPDLEPDPRLSTPMDRDPRQAQPRR